MIQSSLSSSASLGGVNRYRSIRRPAPSPAPSLVAPPPPAPLVAGPGPQVANSYGDAGYKPPAPNGGTKPPGVVFDPHINTTQVGPAGNPWVPHSGPQTPIDPGAPESDANLRSKVYLPGGDPRLTAAQGVTDAAGAAVQGAPSMSDESASLYGRYRSLLSGGQSRFDAAKGVLQNLDENQGLQRTQGIRQIGQSAAALGRTGAGMTTNDLTGLETSLNREREQQLRQLAADTTEGDINDRFRTLDYGVSGASANNADRYRRLDAASGAENQAFNQGASNRTEYRAERGRQDTLAQTSLDNRIRERGLQNSEREQRTARAVALMQASGNSLTLEQALALLGGG